MSGREVPVTRDPPSREPAPGDKRPAPPTLEDRAADPNPIRPADPPPAKS
jgi:hypothetical protein